MIGEKCSEIKDGVRRRRQDSDGKIVFIGRQSGKAENGRNRKTKNVSSEDDKS